MQLRTKDENIERLFHGLNSNPPLCLRVIFNLVIFPINLQIVAGPIIKIN